MSENEDAVEILENTDQLMKETSSQEMDALQEQQEQQLEEIAVENVKEILDMESELQTAKNAGVREINGQMEEQRKKVRLYRVAQKNVP